MIFQWAGKVQTFAHILNGIVSIMKSSSDFIKLTNNVFSLCYENNALGANFNWICTGFNFALYAVITNMVSVRCANNWFLFKCCEININSRKEVKDIHDQLCAKQKMIETISRMLFRLWNIIDKLAKIFFFDSNCHTNINESKSKGNRNGNPSLFYK